MSESMFNPDMLMEQNFEEANSTTRLPVPEGEYPGIVKDVKIREVQRKDGSGSFPMVDVTWLLDSDELRETMGRPEITARQSLMLDITANGSLDMGKGKNVALGRLREALGMNVPGQGFSFAMLNGAGPAKVMVKHRMNEQDPEIVYDEVRSVAKM